jgi:hypothetical protein
VTSGTWWSHPLDRQFPPPRAAPHVPPPRDRATGTPSEAPLNIDLIGPCGSVGLGLPVLGDPRIQHVVRSPQVSTDLGHGWTDSRTNRTASRLLKLLGIPTLSSCWHDHLRFHNSPPIGVFVKSWEGHTSTSIRTSMTHMGHWSYFFMSRCILANMSASSAAFV